MESRKWKYRIVTDSGFNPFAVERGSKVWFTQVKWRYYRGAQTIDEARQIIADAIKEDNWVKQVVEE